MKHLSVPSESGRWLLLRSAAACYLFCATFSTLRVGSLVATDFGRRGLRHGDSLSVPSESGRWLLRHRFAAVNVIQGLFQYPQSRVVGCYMGKTKRREKQRMAFSTLRVGSLVATVPSEQ